MPQSVLMLTIVLCAVLLLLLLFIPLVLIWKLTQNSQSLMLGLLEVQTLENQSLRNQLRSPDVMTLHSLNAATLSQTVSTSDIDDSVVSGDEYLMYQEAMKRQGLIENGLSDDLSAAGWETTLSPAETQLYGGSGNEDGSPVILSDVRGESAYRPEES